MEIEKQIAELEKIVEKMQDENIKLDESILLFEKGLQIAKNCASALKEKKGQLTVLTEEMKKIIND